MKRGRWGGAAALLLVGVLGVAFVLVQPAAGAAVQPHAQHTHAKHKAKSKFRLGDYRVLTSRAIEPFTNPQAYERYGMEFKLTQTKSSQCGGAKHSKQTVYCLAAAYRIGEYGTKPTTAGETWCEGQGYPDGTVSNGWSPVLRLPASGRVTFDGNVYEDGVKAAYVKATFKITPKGKFTGSFEETNWVSTTGPAFLGCTTGKLTLSGKWDARS